MLYGLSLQNGFTLDDFQDVLGHPVVTGEAPRTAVANYDFMGKPIGTGVNTWRPVTTLFFASGYHLWGASALGFHAACVFVYGLCVVVAFLLLRRFFSDSLAFLGACIFLCLGIHVEVVASISHVAETLALLFGLIAILRYISGKWDACLFYLVAVCSKESAFVVPFICLAYSLFWQTRSGDHLGERSPWQDTSQRLRRDGARLGGLFVVAVVFLIVRSQLLPFSVGDSIVAADNNLLGAPLATRFWVALGLLGRYLCQFFFPADRAFDYTYNAIPSVLDIGNGFAWVGVGVLLGAIFWLVRTRHRRQAAFGLVCFGLAYGMFSNTVFLNVIVYAQRVFFSASFWLVFCLCLAANRAWNVPSKQKKVVAIAGVFCLMQTAFCCARIGDWKSNGSLASVQISSQPDSVKGYLHAAKLYADAGAVDHAVWYLAIAAHGRSTYPNQWKFPFAKQQKLPIEQRLQNLHTMMGFKSRRQQYWGMLSQAAVSIFPKKVLPDFHNKIFRKYSL